MPRLLITCSLCIGGSHAVGIGHLDGGREALLRGLEGMLGMAPPSLTRAERIAAYAQALDTAAVPTWQASLRADRWGTVEFLLERRDELRLAGWDGAGGLPLLRGPALAEQAFARTAAIAGEADRVLRIAALLEGGRPLPAHEVQLEEPSSAWPRVWQSVLARLHCRDAPAPDPRGGAGSSLLALQHGMQRDLPPLLPDASFAVRQGGSIHATVQAIVAALAADPAALAQTAIVGWDPQLTAALDGQLRRQGLPTSGAPAAGQAVSVAQVLPLAMGLLWQPADPRLLIDLLTLPVGPIPRQAGQRLAEALAEMPGLGSRTWEHAYEDLVAPANDPQGELRTRLRAWLHHDRIPAGQAVPATLIDARCAVVAGWAQGRAQATADAGLQRSLHHLAAAAALLRRVVAVDGAAVTQPQLVRLLAAVNAHETTETPLPEAAGGPVLLPGWHALRAPVARAIWLGVTVQELARPRWSTGELAALAREGLCLEDGSQLARWRRAADVRGLARVSDRLLIAVPPEPAERRPHPFWTGIRTRIPTPGRIPALDTVDTAPWAGWQLRRREPVLEPPQPRRHRWTAPAALLRDRDRHSFTSLALRLGCPIAWTLQYVARIRPGPIAHLPDTAILRGTFAHAVLAEALRGPLQAPAAAAQAARRIFDERIARDAAPLLFPGASGATDALREAVTTAAAVITRAFSAAGCDRIETEQAFTTTSAGWPLEGAIDLLGLGPDGRRLVLDLKLGSLKDRAEGLAQGRALQLAIYGSAVTPPAAGIGYWILTDQTLVTTEADRVPLAAQDSAHGRVLPDAPAQRVVWQQLATALHAGEGWLATGIIPARPLQPPEEHPRGVDLVLTPGLEAAEQDLCKRCHFQGLCGVARRG